LLGERIRDDAFDRTKLLVGRGLRRGTRQPEGDEKKKGAFH
jgi:hypothetical protein